MIGYDNRKIMTIKNHNVKVTWDSNIAVWNSLC